MKMDRILFGDNQFFGVNHMSEEKARAQSIKFQKIDSIVEVLDIAYAEGIRVFMCTTHERIAQVCDHVRAHPDRYKDFQFYPCMPYAHKYANAVTELGILGALKSFLPDDGAIGALLQGGKAVANKDIEALAGLLIDAEMKMFRGLKTPVIFVQNVMTDLILGLGMNEVFRIFADHVRKKYDAEPGFITMNMPMLLDALEKVGVNNPIICANINSIGFRMCGGIALYEQTIATRRFRPIAMSVFASGALSPRDAVAYVCNQENVESLLFGASSAGNIRQSAKLIRELTKATAAP
jgi:hypothetical protein